MGAEAGIRDALVIVLEVVVVVVAEEMGGRMKQERDSACDENVKGWV